MNRREFLKAFTTPTPSSVDLPPAPPILSLPPVVSVPTAGSPRQYQRGVCVLVEDAHAWLCRDDGGFYAIDAHCSHLGGDVRPAADGFVCQCHGSCFGSQGERIAGPARQNLRYLSIDLDANGHLIIRRDSVVDPRDRLMA